jgi:hypothetical protein
MNTGFHKIEWNDKGDAGMLITIRVNVYRINAGTFQVSKKMIMLKYSFLHTEENKKAVPKKLAAAFLTY